MKWQMFYAYAWGISYNFEWTAKILTFLFASETYGLRFYFDSLSQVMAYHLQDFSYITETDVQRLVLALLLLLLAT
jgi:hypothetical protein